MRNFILIVLLMVLSGGCTLYPDNNDNPKPDTPIVVVDRAPAAEIWIALAHDVESGVIATPKRLAQYVKALIESGDLSESDRAEFDRQFSGASKDPNDFSDPKAVAVKLRGLK